MKLVHWPLIGGLLHLVQRGGVRAGPQTAQDFPRCTKCNSLPINCQCTNHHIADCVLRFSCAKGLTECYALLSVYLSACLPVLY